MFNDRLSEYQWHPQCTGMWSPNGDQSGHQYDCWDYNGHSFWHHNDIAMDGDAHCEIIMGNNVARDIHCDVTMSNDVVMCTYHGITSFA